jgi:hypothetical protein
LALVVLFLLDFFAPPFAAPLLLAFFAMALTSFLGDKFTGREIYRQCFFLAGETIFSLERARRRGGKGLAPSPPGP